MAESLLLIGHRLIAVGHFFQGLQILQMEQKGKGVRGNYFHIGSTLYNNARELTCDEVSINFW